jgi:hypothetical protein
VRSNTRVATPARSNFTPTFSSCKVDDRPKFFAAPSVLGDGFHFAAVFALVGALGAVIWFTGLMRRNNQLIGTSLNMIDTRLPPSLREPNGRGGALGEPMPWFVRAMELERNDPARQNSIASGLTFCSANSTPRTNGRCENGHQPPEFSLDGN